MLPFATITDSGSPEAYGLMVVGLFLLAGLAAHTLGHRLHIPRVTLLLIMGFLASPSVLNLIPEEASQWFPLAARLALSIVGFQLGERFLGKKFASSPEFVGEFWLREVSKLVI